MESSDKSSGSLPVIPRDPERHFKAKACYRCSWKPCLSFRLGGVTEGKWEFVHQSEGGGGDCPFNIGSSWELRSLLSYASFNDLVFAVERVIDHLTPFQRLHANPERFFTDFLDSHRRMEFLVGLWEQGAINVLHVPGNFRLDPKLRQWLIGHTVGGGLAFRKNSDYIAPALTDELADEMAQEKLPLKITDIKWRHKNESRRQKSPETARQKDTLELSATFENYVEGAGVDFFVFGNVSGNRKQLATIHTRCKDMGAIVEWPVDMAKCDDEPGIIFYCEARSLKSKECPIEVEIQEFVLSM